MREYRWRWDIEKIRRTAVADNVVDLMVRKIERLPGATIDVLKTASCIGNVFEVSLLALVHERTADEILACLTPAIAEGFVIPSSDTIKFSHDRIQEAVYSLIPAEDRAKIHYRIGTLLLTNIPEADFVEWLFMIVDQQNAGSGLITDQDEKYRLAELNLRAGKRAKASTAYEMALRYFSYGITCLSRNHWQEQYSLSYDLFLNTAEAEYLCKNVDKSEELFKYLEYNIKPKKDLINFSIEIIKFYHCYNKHKLAVNYGVAALSELGFKIVRNPSWLLIALQFFHVRYRVNKLGEHGLVELPDIAPEKSTIVQMLNAVIQSAWMVNDKLMFHMVLRFLEFSLDNGVSANSSFVLSGYPLILGPMLGKYAEANSFAAFNLFLIKEKKLIGEDDNRGRTYFNISNFINHWSNHLRTNVNLLDEAGVSCLARGDFLYYSYILNNYMGLGLSLGYDLKHLREKWRVYNEFNEKMRDELYVITFKTFKDVIDNLIDGFPAAPDSVSEVLLNDLNIKKLYIVAAWYKIYNSIALFVYDEYTQAFLIINSIVKKALNRWLFGQICIPEYFFVQSLIVVNNNERVLLKGVLKNQRKMLSWARNCPENFLHKYLLVQAELARVTGKKQKDETGRRCEAEELYDRAIASAHENEFQQNEAIGNELAAKYYLSKGRTKVAALYMKEARDGFGRWGATAKVKQLEEKYPDLLRHDVRMAAGPGQTELSAFTTVEMQSHALDYLSAMKASQALSGEIVLPSLLEKLIRIAIENAGATHGCLLMERDGELTLEVEGDAEKVRVSSVANLSPIPSPIREGCASINSCNGILAKKIFDSKPLSSRERGAAEPGVRYPSQIVNLVSRTHESIIIPDAARETRFTTDPYIKRGKPLSILCMPVLNQGKLAGVIYLENSLVSGAFTTDRSEAVRMILAQAAVSIENARLYADMEQRVRERTATIERQKADIERDIMLAQRIQSSLLPQKIPAIGNGALAFKYVPMMGVGGDFLDVMYHADDVHHRQLGLFICDVSGHGVSAALTASMVKMSLAAWRESIDRPAMTLAGIRDSLAGKLGGNFITACACALDLDTGVLTAARAGHPPALVVRKDGSAEFVGPRGRLINDLMMPNYEEARIQLYDGDTLVLFTDGITEARRGDAMLGEEGLADFIRANRSLGPHDLCQAVFDHVVRFAGRDQLDDDFTIMAFTYTR